MPGSRFVAGVIVAAVSVAAVTGAIALMQPYVPVLSLGALYVFAVLPTAVFYGLPLATIVSVASMLAFNWFFLPPTHTFQLRDRENWLALAVYLVTGFVVSALASRSRRRARAAVEAETLRQSEAVKTTILRALGHDLRSPLTAIRAAIDGLASPEIALESGDRDELLRTIQLEVRRLDRLVANLLDLSRLEVGAARSRPELWPPDLLVAQALDQLGAAVERVIVSVPDDLPPLRVDAVQVERALANLLQNALEASPDDDPVELDVTPLDGRAVFRVRDRGGGVAASDRARIFEPFERGRAGGRGTGLGLAIARGFAEANGGRVWLDADAAGTEFVLELPVDEHAVAAGR